MRKRKNLYDNAEDKAKAKICEGASRVSEEE